METKLSEVQEQLIKDFIEFSEQNECDHKIEIIKRPAI